MKKPQHPHLIFPLFFLAWLLSACEPTCYPYLVVDQVSVKDDKPYVHVAEHVSWGFCPDVSTPDRYYVSPNEGETWKELTAPAETMFEQDVPDNKQITSCITADRKTCYRITGKANVEVSTDGGATWRIDWQIPPDRQRYMIRQPAIVDLVAVEPDLVPYDLAVLNTNNGLVVLVAYGNQGMLVKSADGAWNRYPVETAAEGVRPAAPIPFQAADIESAIKTLTSESTWIFFLAFSYLVFLATFSWLRIINKIPKVKPSTKGWLTVFMIAAGLAFLLLLWLFIISHRGDTPTEWRGLDQVLLYICTLPAIIGSALLLIFAFSLPNKTFLLLSGLLAMALASIFFILAWLPFGLWAWGNLPYYWQALVIAATLSILALIFGFLVEKRLIRRFSAGSVAVTKVQSGT